MKLFDLNWKFSLGNDVPASVIDFDDRGWRNVDLPHDWAKDTELANSNSKSLDSASYEFGWYRKHFEIPPDWMDKSIQIDFEGICSYSEIFVNGASVADTDKDNSSFQAILNPYLNAGENNVIAIRIAVPQKTDSSWKAQTGIYKHVWLVIKESPVFKD